MSRLPRWMRRIVDRMKRLHPIRRGTVALLAAALAGCIPAGRDPGFYAETTPPRTATLANRPPPVADRPPAAPMARTPTVRPAVANASRVAGASYTARTGDTLLTIAERTGIPADAIAAANAMVAPFRIYAGQELVLPGGRYHTVRDGEVGVAIAAAYGIEWDRIVAANLLDEPAILREGQRLLIPDPTR